MLEITNWPSSRDAVLILSLSGWVDAGFAGAQALSYLEDELTDVTRIGQVDLAECGDLQRSRPTVRLLGGEIQGVDWPIIEVSWARAPRTLGGERDVFLVSGPEPSHSWQRLGDELIEMARRCDVALVLTIAGMPAPVSHRRPSRIMTTVAGPPVEDFPARPARADYVGPTGAQTALQSMLGDAGFPALGLWAEVPHYVSGSFSPPGTAALISEVANVAGIALRADSFGEQITRYMARIDENLDSRPDVAELVRGIEEAMDSGDDGWAGGDLDEESSRLLADRLAGSADLVGEIERFLAEES